MWIDCHAHLNFEAFADDWEEVVDRAIKAGVEKMVVVGTDINSSQRAVEMASQNKHLWASVGIHPHHARGIQDLKFTIQDLRKLAEKERVVAIGEVGLDYHVYKNSKYEVQNIDKELQKELLQMQVVLAREMNKPVIFHSRECEEEVLEIARGVRGVFHCFGGSKKYVKKILAAGFYVSFTGQITYVPDRAEVAAEVPVDRLLVETDCPYMPPYKEDRRSEPKDVIIIGQSHAQARGLRAVQVETETTANAEELFGLKE